MYDLTRLSSCCFVTAIEQLAQSCLERDVLTSNAVQVLEEVFAHGDHCLAIYSRSSRAWASVQSRHLPTSLFLLCWRFFFWFLVFNSNIKGSRLSTVGMGRSGDLDLSLLLAGPDAIPLTRHRYASSLSAAHLNISNVTCIPDSEFRDMPHFT